MLTIQICKDFSDTPGGRYICEGEYSGEKFREELLLPKYNEAEDKGEKLRVEFDGCYGFGTSFLEEAFGGLVRVYKKEKVLDRLVIISKEDETIPGLIEKYVKEAESKRG
ncbi:MAG: STAS-like domain-containing protein [Lachnospiraceae bacterium]|nr:STAS-like domain-containing protein [Lachnospiraceae bacterium]